MDERLRGDGREVQLTSRRVVARVHAHTYGRFVHVYRV